MKQYYLSKNATHYMTSLHKAEHKCQRLVCLLTEQKSLIPKLLRTDHKRPRGVIIVSLIAQEAPTTPTLSAVRLTEYGCCPDYTKNLKIISMLKRSTAKRPNIARTRTPTSIPVERNCGVQRSSTSFHGLPLLETLPDSLLVNVIFWIKRWLEHN